MQPEDRDAALLWDILNACREISQFVRSCNVDTFEQNKVLRYAVERQILVIGEASRKLSDNIKTAHPEIPQKIALCLDNSEKERYKFGKSGLKGSK